MKAADTSASSAMADCTLLTVVSRLSVTAEMDTFMIVVSTTSTNIAIASRIARRLLFPGATDWSGWCSLFTSSREFSDMVHALGAESGAERASS